MKRALTYILMLLCSLCGVQAAAAGEVDSVLRRLDDAIRDADKFDGEKMQHVASLRTRLQRTNDYADRYAITDELVGEFMAYNCDSAVQYANRNIDLARRQGDLSGETRARIAKSEILGRAGLFHEAMNLLHSIRPAELPDDLRQYYYSVSYSIYQHMFENTVNTEYEADYARLAEQYCDSALSLARPGTFDYMRLRAAKLVDQGRYRQAIEVLDSASKSYHEGQREYSMIKSTQAFPVEQLSPGSDEAIILLAQSAISDVRGSIKENMSIRWLAEKLYAKGDVDKANRFVKKSLDDASFFSARMRTAQVGQMLPLIDRQYDLAQSQARQRLRLTVYILIAVAVVLAIGFFLIIRLTRRLRRANNHLSDYNSRISQLNDDLQRASEVGRELNRKLSEANAIKETYLRQFMEMSSRSINSLEHFRKSMLLLQTTGKTEELRKSLKSSAAVNDALKELYMTFDQAFLTIFPDFVAKFNSLLRPDCHVEQRPDEPFSTEMRIYALLRMGISDNHRIADFLRCSLSTIYTYRSKMKARALDPDNFEAEVIKV